MVCGTGKNLGRGAAVREDVKNDPFVVRIAAVAMSFPIAGVRVDLDATANRLAAIDGDRGFGEVGTRLMIPNPKLNEVDGAPVGAREFAPKFPVDPACLQLVLIHLRTDAQEVFFV